MQVDAHAHLIQEGTHVVIVDNSGQRRILKIKNKKIKQGKVMLDMGKLIGQPFATHWQVTDPNSGEIEQITDVKVLTKAFLD
jgi:protein-tyrosine-phosphatase